MREPVWGDWITAGNREITVPDRALRAQAVAVGGGGGGRGGWYNNGGRGAGGGAGEWASGEWDVTPNTRFSYAFGAGGAGGHGGSIVNSQPDGAPGGVTTIGPVTAAGGEAGPGGRDYRPGQSPGSYTAFGRTFTGGAETAGDGQFPGSAPGGGGAPGKAGGFLGGGTRGGNGASGAAWYRFLTTPPNPGEWGKKGSMNTSDDVIESLHFEGSEIEELWLDGVLVWNRGLDVETVTIVENGSTTAAQDQFRAALTGRGLDYRTVTTVPFLLDTSQVTNMSSMFSGCAALTTVPELDTSKVTNMSSMFSGCAALTTVPELDTSKVTNMFSTFSGCAALESVILRGIGPKFYSSSDTPGGGNSPGIIDLKYTIMSPAAANNFMDAIGQAYPGCKISLPATAQGCDTAKATQKGWKVTVG
jgi:surface protein